MIIKTTILSFSNDHCFSSSTGVLSFAVQLYFPGSSYTSDLVDATQPRYINLKSTIEKAVSIPWFCLNSAYSPYLAHLKAIPLEEPHSFSLDMSFGILANTNDQCFSWVILCNRKYDMTDLR